MKSKELADLTIRLLQLEQRFVSYYRLHEEELGEIKDTLQGLRQDVLKLAQESEANLDEAEPLASMANHDSREEASDDFSDDMAL